MLKLLLLPLALLLSAFLFFTDDTKNTSEEALKENTHESRSWVSENLGQQIKANKFPENQLFKIESESKELKIKYTLDPLLQKESEELLKRYKPDYGAIFMIDAKTGKVLAMSSFQKANSKADNLNLQATFPAASIFKVITAAAAVDHAGIDPNHKIAFNGGNYTLYKKNVLSDSINRWTRFISLKDAFARSINTAFGRLTLESLEPKVISDYAKRFMFNSRLQTDFPVEQSTAIVPEEKGYELTQVASGYNRFNTLSPVHGAMIAAAIINQGKVVHPYIVNELTDSNDKPVYTAQPFNSESAIKPESAKKVQEMMEQTVLTGTSRKTFRKIVREKKFQEIEMGGKTGHFTGMNPKGRTDWFVGYASDGDDNKVAIAAITVNIQKWTVKSSALGEMMIRKHFKTVLEEKAVSKLNNTNKRNRG